MVDVYNHVKHCMTHPKFLHSNSTSHRWVFGAIAELIDNAIDPDVSASQFCIDMKEFNGEPCLVFMDNGCGLVPEKLHKMLSFGHSKKQMTDGDRSIGKHGNGFKSGTMRLGKDVLVLTKCADSMTVGFLSQTFLADTGAEDILIPQVSWDLNGNRLSLLDLEVEESLRAICKYSIFDDEASLLCQLGAIPVTGSILIISNLRRHEGVLELDFETDPNDIRIASEINNSQFQQLRPNQPNTTEVPMDYSLRAYVSILYKVPRMQVFIRDKKVKTKRIAGILSQKETESYKPTGVGESIKIELGFNTENKNLYGMMLYHRNRLIKAYMRVGMQLEENERGMGVIGLAEADFLQPTHNKQDFDDTTAYRRLLKKLSEVLAEYWWEKKERVHGPKLPIEPRTFRRGINVSSLEDVPDVIWVQCDNPQCLKWRVLPPGTDVSALPDIWYCEYHPDEKFRIHDEPEQEWDPSVQHEIMERRKERKREYDREKKEREAERKRQRLEAAAKDNQDKQKEALKEAMKAQTDLARRGYKVLLRQLEEANEKRRLLEEELARKQQKEDAARLPMRQDQALEQQGGFRAWNTSANGHTLEEQEDEPTALSIGNTEGDSLRSLRGPEDRVERRMPRYRAPHHGVLPLSYPTDGHQLSIEWNGDMHGDEASESPSLPALGNVQLSVTAPKAVTQKRLKASQPHGPKTSHLALPKELATQGTTGAPQQSQQKGNSMSSASSRVVGLHGPVPENRRRISKIGRASQPTGFELATTQELDNRLIMPLAELRPPSVTPLPPPPDSPGCAPSLNPSLPSTQGHSASAIAAAQQICSFNQQTQCPVDQRPSLSGDSSQQDVPLLPQAANGAPADARDEDTVTEQGVEQSPESHLNRNGRNEQCVSSDNGTPSPGLRPAVPQAQNDNASGMLSVHLAVDSKVSTSSSGSETELTKAFFQSQRHLRLCLNTLSKLGGTTEPTLIELDSLPTKDSEVVDICVKAKEHIDNMTQNSRQEIAKLKAELAYIMVDKVQNGQDAHFKIQNIGNKRATGMEVLKEN